MMRFARFKELAYVKLMLKITAHLLAERPDIIYTHNAIAALPSVVVSRLRHVPVVLDMDDLLSGYSSLSFCRRCGPLLEFAIARRATQTIVTSEALGEELRARGIQRFRLVRHGVAQDVFVPRDCEKEDLLVYTGGIEKHDGVTLLPRAAAVLVKEFPQLKVLVVGMGKRLPEVRRLVSEFGLIDHFQFISWVKYKEIPQHIARAKIGLIPERASFSAEVASALKGFEFMAMGLPTVVSDLRGMREQVGDNERGLTFEPGNVVDFTAKIRRLLLNPELRNELGRRGRQFVLEHCDWDKNMEEVAHLCEELVPVPQCAV